MMASRPLYYLRVSAKAYINFWWMMYESCNSTQLNISEYQKMVLSYLLPLSSATIHAKYFLPLSSRAPSNNLLLCQQFAINKSGFSYTQTGFKSIRKRTAFSDLNLGIETPQMGEGSE